MTKFADETFISTGESNFNVNFPYINEADVKVTVNGDEVAFTFNTSTQINITLGTTSGDSVRLYRETPRDTTTINERLTITAGSMPNATDIELLKKMVTFILQELLDSQGDVSTLPSPVGQEDKVLSSDGINFEFTTLAEIVAPSFTVLNVRNETGSPINKGEAVYITGWDVDESMVLIAKADADDITKRPIIGLTKDVITSGSNGLVVNFGPLEGVNTSSYSLNDTLYSSTSGGLTINPLSVAFPTTIGVVHRVDASDGIIHVGIIDTELKTPFKLKIRNESGGTLTKGELVAFGSYNTTFNLILGIKADSDSVSTMPAIGIVLEDISNNSNGYIQIAGALTNINTSGLGAAGTKVFVSGTAGALSSTPGTVAQEIGIVTRNHATLGEILLNFQPLSASTTEPGVVELATSAEAITGTDTVRAVTPAGLNAAIDAIAGGWQLVQTQTPSGVSSVGFTTGFEANYDHMWIISALDMASDAVGFDMRVSIDGATYRSTAGDYTWVFGAFSSAPGAEVVANLSDTELTLVDGSNIGRDLGDAAGEPPHLIIIKGMHLDNDGSSRKIFLVKGYTVTSNGRHLSLGGNGSYKGTTDDILGVQFLSSVNFTATIRHLRKLRTAA